MKPPMLNGRDVDTVDGEGGLDLLVSPTSLRRRICERFVRAYNEVGPRSPSLVEGKDELRVPESSTYYSSVVSELGPKRTSETVPPEHSVGLDLEVGKSGHEAVKHNVEQQG